MGSTALIVAADERRGRTTMTDAERHPRLADRSRCALLLVDLQESYRGKLYEERRLAKAAGRLVEAAKILGIPVLVTEQYPERLGHTWAEIADLLPADAPRIAKRSFSALGSPELLERLSSLGRSQVVVAGIETHVCVSQTAHDLVAGGFGVHVPRDAVTSRFSLEDEMGYAKMTGSGVVPTSAEAVLFEWVVDSRAPEFKAIHRLVV
jgi:nicotinamidase-related amidase